MRNHGVSNFPNPTLTDHNGQAVAYIAPPELRSHLTFVQECEQDVRAAPALTYRSQQPQAQK